MEKGKLDIMMDVAWGSSGKAKLAGYLARKHNIAASVCQHSPNAGHTFVDDDGISTVLRYLPSASVNQDTQLLLGPDSVIDIGDLGREIQATNSLGRVFVHPHACILDDTHAVKAAETGLHIAGTMKGTGHALAEKMLRKKGVTVAKHHAKSIEDIGGRIADTRDMLLTALKDGPCLAEMAQGFDLSLNWGFEWPYASSRDVTIGTALNNAGVSHRHVGDVWGCVRPFPIRVGNVYKEEGNCGLFNDMRDKEIIGYSGPCWHDQREMTWDEVTQISGSPEPLVEITTVTKRVRRVFSFSRAQLAEFCKHNEPSKLFVNFIQYLDWSVAGETDADKLLGSEVVIAFLLEVEHIAKQYNPNAIVALVGTGARNCEMIELPRGVINYR